MAPVGVRLLLLAAVSSLYFIDRVAGSSGLEGDDPPVSKYPNCGGMSQSPIDIETNSTEYKSQEGGLKFHGYSTTEAGISFTLINKKHTAHIRVNDNTDQIYISGSAMLGDREYILRQFHFHWGSENRLGSEHTVDGHAYAMEVHFVHYDSKLGNLSYAANETEGLAVLGAFFKVGNESEGIGKLVEHFDSIINADEHTDIETFVLDSLLPKNKDDYYRYNGSLTTPPCYESVIWTVFKDPITMSQAQLDKFRQLLDDHQNPMVNNFRPTKPLNGRHVYRTYKDLPDDGAVLVRAQFLLLCSMLFVYLASNLAI